MFQPMNQNVPVPQQPAEGISSMTMLHSHAPVKHKRSREEGDAPSQIPPVQCSLPTPSATKLPQTHEVPLQSPCPSFKRSRCNNYEAPREVKPSLLTAMGSLVGGGDSKLGIRVPLRRRLSGSAIDAFLGGSDNMEMDQPSESAANSRPRSMSF
jgi:hypothetical protein